MEIQAFKPFSADTINPENILQKLRDIPGWVCAKRTVDANGKENKPPCDLNGKIRDLAEIRGYPINDALRAARANKEIVGIGFNCAFLPDGWHIGDYDKCHDPATGQFTPEAEALIERLNTHTELSISGTGLRWVGTGDTPNGEKFEVAGKSLEVYTNASRRYLTFTGCIVFLGGDTVADCGKPLIEFVESHATKGFTPASAQAAPAASNNDISVVRLAMDTPKAVGWDDPTHAKFLALYNGETLHASVSQSDMAFLIMLAYLLAKNADLIRSAFEQSKRIENPSTRERWERRSAQEISRACMATETVYTPKSASQPKPKKNAAPNFNSMAENAAEWQSDLLADSSGKVKSCALNVSIIINNHPDWAGVVGFNEFSGKIEKTALPPYENSILGEWRDFDDYAASIWISQEFKSAFSDDVVAKAVTVSSHSRKFHPVQDYLNSLTWDNDPRVENWLERYLGGQADDPRYLSAVGKCWLISAVARVMQPGCKVDTMLILEGEQGIGKSSALRTLAKNETWFSDAHLDIGNKDSYLALRGKWLIEFAELDSMNRADADTLKAFLTRPIDQYREPYGRRMSDVPRHCVFAGTGNRNEYLKDVTGARRFWPVRCTQIDHAALSLDVDQLWAEAMTLYKAGTAWWIDTNTDYVKAEQEKRFDADVWEDLIENWLVDKWEVSTSEILEGCIGIEPAKQSKLDQMRVRSVMDRMTKEGWQKSPGKVLDTTGKRCNGYIKI